MFAALKLFNLEWHEMDFLPIQYRHGLQEVFVHFLFKFLYRTDIGLFMSEHLIFVRDWFKIEMIEVLEETI